MNSTSPAIRTSALGAVLLVFLGAQTLFAQCTLTETKRKFEGAEHTIIRMENQRIIVEVVPELEGRIITYTDKSRKSPTSGFEWLDDCPYHYGGRWEGEPFQYKILSRGPDRAALTVSGGGKIAVALLRHLTGADVANPLDLKVERTMTIEPGTTRLKVDVKITNAGDGVAPQFRYMVHAVFGQVPPMETGRALWFLPTSKTVEFFGESRGNREMGIASGGAPIDHPFSGFTPGFKADKPRYEAGGWGAVLTSGGPAYIYYDRKQYDFMQYWFGGDSEWHFTFEPHTRPIDLKPGESTSASFTLAYDSRDVPFDGPTVAYEPPVIPDVLMPGGTLVFKTRATTVRDHAESAKVIFEAKDAGGKTLLGKTVDAQVEPFKLTAMSAEFKLPETAALGVYSWKASADDGRELAIGKFEIVTAAEQARRQTEAATAELKVQIAALKQELSKEQEQSRRRDELWKQGTDLALTWNDPRTWPAGAAPAGQVNIAVDPAGVAVLGQWKDKENLRIKSFHAPTPSAWPGNAEKMLAALGQDRKLIRDVAVDPSGKALIALLVDPPKNRVEIVRIDVDGHIRRFGDFSDKPGEDNAKLGTGARAICVDGSGNIWVTTNAWGKTSVLGINQDGAPFEEAVIGAKGALKKFSPDGKLLSAIGTLWPPTDLALAAADGTPVVLCAYRQVSTYHGTQVRQGVLVIGTQSGARLSELKVSGGSIAVDSTGRVWTADVAGHIACFDAGGHKLFDIKNSPAAAVLDAVLPANSPLPAIVRRAPDGGVFVLSTLKRSLERFTSDAPAAQEQPVPDSAGPLHRFTTDNHGAIVVGENGVWKP
ncbi:MAG TPA: hypothetical protein VFE47_07250 [Tepidisphaeraceae bacterium]|jgi:sugar lactone lactonase YvrE|nr:hypothetical protein [Tepidisphaeraceae bacterium]